MNDMAISHHHVTHPLSTRPIMCSRLSLKNGRPSRNKKTKSLEENAKIKISKASPKLRLNYRNIFIAYGQGPGSSCLSERRFPRENKIISIQEGYINATYWNDIATVPIHHLAKLSWSGDSHLAEQSSSISRSNSVRLSRIREYLFNVLIESSSILGSF